MKALQAHGAEFFAVVGTSAGGLCAIIWSTGRIEDGIKVWKEIDRGGSSADRLTDACGAHQGALHRGKSDLRL
jgi:predicted acylesterase/phospholipase RssA